MKGEISSRKEHVETSHDGSKGNSDFITVECLLAFDTDEDKKKVLDLVTQTIQNCTNLAQSSPDQVRRD